MEERQAGIEFEFPRREVREVRFLVAWFEARQKWRELLAATGVRRGARLADAVEGMFQDKGAKRRLVFAGPAAKGGRVYVGNYKHFPQSVARMNPSNRS